MELAKKNRRGRPPVSIGGSVPLTSVLPVSVHDRLCRECLETGQSLSELVRKQLVAVQDAVDIVPLIAQLQADKDEAICIARQLLDINRELLDERTHFVH